LLNKDGEEVRVVGGAVRNALMGLPVTDIDLATTWAPEQVVALGCSTGHPRGADRASNTARSRW
jgi:poly(A) polymerase